MALLFSFQASNESIFPPALRARLRELPLLKNVGEPALRRLLSEAEWFGLPGGTKLTREGENDSAVFLVVTGSLGVFMEGDRAPRRLVATIPAGETVGEMSLLTGESHSATLVALRDTELLRLGSSSFDMLITRYPRVMLNLLKIVMHRLKQTTRQATQKARAKTFAVIPLQEGVRGVSVVRPLVDTLVEMGAKAAVLDRDSIEQSTGWFNRFEAEHDAVFYLGDAPDSAWTHLCLRQADRVFLVARSNEQFALHPFARRYFKRDLGAPPELLLVHASGKGANLPEHVELRKDLFETHHHIREGNASDIRRLARFIAGSSVNVVLAGGGARGFAHIGVLKALHEAGVPFDYVSGTSMGGIIAAGLALEWSIEEITERMRDVFVVNNPLSDYTFPIVALFRGAKVTAFLRKHFGEVRIEDLPKPYFCVSSDLTSGRDYVHRSGLLWRALRASVALPGILPPVPVEDGHLLVDGGVMNNLPVDVMAEESRGPIIAVDVSGEIDLRAYDPKYGERSLWSRIFRFKPGTPSIISILMRAGTVGSDAQRRIVREQAEFLYEPPLEGIGMGDWKAFDRAIAQGYAHAMLQIERNGIPLSDSWASGPAVAIRRPPK